ncbi:MAG: type II toxin-antitoxin system RelE/ParE family toxin [Mariprofundaceae bacterium]|nr:type II toxin-antitoxin system RelE/ParE family toxin [Mariprofundaceae bacterium]
MSLPVTFHRAASAEFIEATAWYDSKRSGLAVEFVAEIERCLSLASENPFQFVTVRENIRRVVAKRFPYSVYFRVEKHRIVVLAVFHGSRDPAIWLDRG